MNITEKWLLCPSCGCKTRDQAAAGYRVEKLPAVLPKVQTGDAGQCDQVCHNKIKRVRRQDAEPMIPKGMALRFTVVQ